jgi:CHASE2 domain-containing sensor protein
MRVPVLVSTLGYKSTDMWRKASRCRLLKIFLRFVLLVIVSFSMLWLGDKINAQGMAVTRFMARAQAPLTAQIAYPATGRDQISVVMYDGQFLQSQGAAWPISYQQHADWIGRLVEAPGPKPKALLIDITFTQERDDASLRALREKLCEVRKVHGVPIFLAALPHPSTGRLSVRKDLGGSAGVDGDSCFTLVGVDYLPDGLDGVAWSYQLHRHFNGTSWVHGKPADDSAGPTYRSAALAMAEDAVGLKDIGEGEPMALVWGHASARQADRPQLLQDCRSGEWSWFRLIPHPLRQWWDAPEQAALCPYHRTLSFAQVGEMDDSKLADFVGGKYVFVGANVPGHNDFAFSPVHGLIPGVHMHAMALDNFLTYGRDYKVNAEWALPPPNQLLQPGLLAIAIVFFVHLVWTAARACLARRRKRRTGYQTPKHFWGRVVEAMLIGVGWAVRITLQSIAAILLIALLQKWSRIGMLPVVELVGMTLLAEGLGYMAKIKWLVSGSSDKSVQQTEKAI